MLISLYLFILPIFVIVLFFIWKFILHRKEVLAYGNSNNFTNEKKINRNFEEAKEIVFVFFEDLGTHFSKLFKILLHWILHLFVILLGFISDLTDILYAKARDFFLHTATKEKDVVSKFWHTLKEYKKEKELEKE